MSTSANTLYGSPRAEISVVLPVLNEEKYLADSVSAILNQKFDGRLEVILAIGPSQDKTMEIAHKLQREDARVVIIENPTGRTAAGLNLAIAASSYSIIVRVDGHSNIPANYCQMAYEILKETGAVNVGGIMDAKGRSVFEKSVARAMRSPLGVGASRFHTGGTSGEVDTVYLGAFRKEALLTVGGFEERFTRAQDWEKNYRIRTTGGTVWFNPNLFVTYRPRNNVRALAKQYFEYGSWRHEVMRRHPQTKRTISALRYFAPPLAVALIAIGKVLGTVGLFMSNYLIWAYLLPLGYLALTLLSSLTLIKRARGGALWVPIVLMTMQMSWGIGFLTSRNKR